MPDLTGGAGADFFFVYMAPVLVGFIPDGP